MDHGLLDHVLDGPSRQQLAQEGGQRKRFHNAALMTEWLAEARHRYPDSLEQQRDYVVGRVIEQEVQREQNKGLFDRMHKAREPDVWL